MKRHLTQLDAFNAGSDLMQSGLKSSAALLGAHTSRPGWRSARAAFTLFELLIAVGLTSLLVVSLFSALQITFDLQADSHEQITRQQVARAILRQMTRDIQSTVFVKRKVTDETEGTTTSTSGSSSGSTTSSGTSGGTSGSTGTTAGSSGGTGSSGSGSGSSAGGSGTADSTGSTSSGTSSASLDGNSYGQSSIDPETVMTTYTNGLVGTTSDLQLFVSRPDRNLAYVVAEELTTVAERTSDLLIIRYLMADKGASGLGSAIADRESPGRSSGPVGLARMEGDLFGLSTAISDDEELPQVAASRLLATEVSKLEYRYFDGATWQEEWDSTALNEMPKAVEIVLTLRSQKMEDSEFSDEDRKVDPYAIPDTIHRMVVPIPVAEPFVMESAL